MCPEQRTGRCLHRSFAFAPVSAAGESSIFWVKTSVNSEYSPRHIFCASVAGAYVKKYRGQLEVGMYVVLCEILRKNFQESPLRGTRRDSIFADSRCAGIRTG
ncbi:hypothetical protein SAMN06265222_10999 [Neorhodopirellula lusitana]|uniref:Uncharacterized protein n=1 Tax=Neorhodopirellula lusitana TaxID=445327 RepID=A0ABY1QCD3_9BACT|nr:hypothetical protein SAMN06265222_10999 [Neorhodopirellula lusitana]